MGCMRLHLNLIPLDIVVTHPSDLPAVKYDLFSMM